MRDRYIRFFISSTFADMKRERDFLQEVFKGIVPVYQKRGWQIETVDLRWGISTEAGYHNKTMQVCEQELLRCQQLSPKPNFIVLIGERYGWIPLPEKITAADYALLKMTDEEKTLFDTWYLFDKNALPKGQYLLRPRQGVFRDDTKWRERVELPLKRMFQRNSTSSQSFLGRLLARGKQQDLPAYGLSATEQEIRLGALEVDDASDHVIAYFRELKNIPHEKRDAFTEADSRCAGQMAELKRRLTDKLGQDNIYKARLSYEEYCQERFAVAFKQEMERRITATVDRVIEECGSDLANNENEQHRAMAATEAEGFVGREEVLSYIDDYLHDIKASRALWIKASSGAGKSALLAKVAETYKDEFHVICRFCGRTRDASSALSLLRSIWWNLKQVDTEVKCSGIRKYMDFPGHSYKPWECFKCLLSKMGSDKPVLVIIDAINQAEEDTEGFSLLKWLDDKLSPAVKVIVSSTDALRYSTVPENIIVYTLLDMGSDAWQQVSHLLMRKGRILTAEQETKVKEIISQSDHSAIFLDVLGKYLCRVTSEDSLDGLPHTLTELMGYLLDDLSRPENHGPMIVRKVISLLAADRIGLSQGEVLDLLSRDDAYYAHVKAESHHEIAENGERIIPPILWSRLQADMEPFLRHNSSKAGHVLTLYHSELKRAIIDSYLATFQAKKEAVKALYDYYNMQVSSGDLTPHALLEVVHCGVALLSFGRQDDPDLFQATGVSIYHLLTGNASFLMEKALNHPKSLMDDYLKALPYFNIEDQKTLLTVQGIMVRAFELMDNNDDNSLRKKSEILPGREHLLCYLWNLPPTMPLRKAIQGMEGTEDLMENIYPTSDSDHDDGTLYVVPELGENPCMSADGTKVASVFENGYQVRIIDLRAPLIPQIVNLNEPVQDMACSSDMHYVAIRTRDCLKLGDAVANRTVFEHPLSEKGSFSLSDTGIMVILDNGRMNIIDQQGKTLYSDNDVLCCMITPSGRYVWLVDSTFLLHRIEVLADKDVSYRQLLPEDFRKASDKGDDKKGKDIPVQMSIVSCLDDCCAVTMSGAGSVCCLLLQDKPPHHVLFYNASWLKYGTNGHVVFEKRCYRLYSQDREGSTQLIQQSEVAWHCASPDLTLLLTCPLDEQFSRVIDVTRVKLGFNRSTGNQGVNSLACSRDGQRIWVAKGFNFGIDYQQAIVQIADGKRTAYIPPVGRNFQYVTQVSASPDGSLLALSIQGYLNGGGCETMVIAADGKPIIRQNTGTFSAIGLAFTEDGRYVAARTGHLICDVEPHMFLFNSQGKKLYESGERNDLSTQDFMCFSRNNRYVFNSWDYMDLLTPDAKSKSIEFNDLCHVVPLGMMAVRYKYFLVQPPVGNGFLSYGKGGEIFFNHFDSAERSVFKLPAPYQPIACSPSGRFIYLIQDDKLSLWDWIGTGQIFPLMDKVQWIVPALDDSHIYVIRHDYMILLMDVWKREVKQKAYMGRTVYQQACAQGLAATNDYCEVVLLRPDPSLVVNQPAPVTLVRHWDLERRELQTAMAVCPACGKHIHMTDSLREVLRPAPDNFEDIHRDHWSDPRLHGYACPHCKIPLSVNPYIL